MTNIDFSETINTNKEKKMQGFYLQFYEYKN